MQLLYCCLMRFNAFAHPMQVGKELLVGLPLYRMGKLLRIKSFHNITTIIAFRIFKGV